MARIRINSNQIFENHEDSFFEEYESEIVFLEDGFRILYDNSEISFDGEKVFVKNSNMVFEVEIGKRSLTNMNTPYGVIELEITGEKFNFIKEPFCFDLRYFIKFGNTEKYINELQILVVDK